MTQDTRIMDTGGNYVGVTNNKLNVEGGAETRETMEMVALRAGLLFRRQVSFNSSSSTRVAAFLTEASSTKRIFLTRLKITAVGQLRVKIIEGGTTTGSFTFVDPFAVNRNVVKVPTMDISNDLLTEASSGGTDLFEHEYRHADNASTAERHVPTVDMLDYPILLANDTRYHIQLLTIAGATDNFDIEYTFVEEVI